MEKKELEKAVALRYDDKKDSAPRVTAKGQGCIAQKIKELALANNIPVHRDDALIELLSKIDIDREIPPELYAAIAEILSWIYKANNQIKESV